MFGFFVIHKSSVYGCVEHRQRSPSIGSNVTTYFGKDHLQNRFREAEGSRMGCLLRTRMAKIVEGHCASRLHHDIHPVYRLSNFSNNRTTNARVSTEMNCLLRFLIDSAIGVMFFEVPGRKPVFLKMFEDAFRECVLHFCRCNGYRRDSTSDRLE